MNHYTFEATLSCGCEIKYKFQDRNSYSSFVRVFENWLQGREGATHRSPTMRHHMASFHPNCPYRPRNLNAPS